jgi:hypothetical protein
MQKNHCGNSGLQKYSLKLYHRKRGFTMDDIAESLITRFISQLKVRLVEVFEVFGLELAMPLLLNSKQCKKLLGIVNEVEFQRVSHLK